MIESVRSRIGRVPWTLDDLAPGERAMWDALGPGPRQDVFAPAVTLAKRQAADERKAALAERARIMAERDAMSLGDRSVIELGERLDALREATSRDDAIKIARLRDEAVVWRAVLVVTGD